MKATIALVGDRNESVLAHRAIPEALDLAAKATDSEIHGVWIFTKHVATTDLSKFDGIWCVPASPYESDEGALLAIRFARERLVPFLGTCGGYQYATLEFARNVLDLKDAENLEVNPDAQLPLITNLACKLVEVNDIIRIDQKSEVFAIYKTEVIKEDYHCSFGVNRDYLFHFEASSFKFVGWDKQGDPRIHELLGHPFFIGTAFQPERLAFKHLPHPLIVRFIEEAIKHNPNNRGRICAQHPNSPVVVPRPQTDTPPQAAVE